MGRRARVAVIALSVFIVLMGLTFVLGGLDIPLWAPPAFAIAVLLTLGFAPFAVALVVQLRQPTRPVSAPVLIGIAVVLAVIWEAIGHLGVFMGSRALGALLTIGWWFLMAGWGADLARWMNGVSARVEAPDSSEEA